MNSFHYHELNVLYDKFNEDSFLKKFNEKSPYLKEIINRCDYLLKGQIIFDDVLDMETCFDPYSFCEYSWNKYPNDDPEWAYMLARHGFLVDLAAAYALTGETKYLLKWKNLITDFIKQNSPAEINSLSWRPIDAGIRLMNWMKSFQYISFENEIEQELKKNLLASIRNHIVFILEQYNRKYDLSNWGVLAIGGVAATLTLLPQIEISQSQKKFVIEKLFKQLKIQFSELGLHWEQSPLYHHEVIMVYLYLIQLDFILGKTRYQNFDAKIRKAIEASYYYADKTDQLLSLNDSDSVDATFVYDVYRGMGYLKDRAPKETIFFFISKHYMKNDYPHKDYAKYYFDSEAGFFAFKDQDIYFTFFNGSHGSSHGHASNGSITLNLKNKEIIVDSGRYTYKDGPHRIALKSEAYHNSIMIEKYNATNIKSSWEYNTIAEPLFTNFKEFEYGFLIEASWLGHVQGCPTVYKRSILYTNQTDSIIIYDQVDSNLTDEKVVCNFNLSDEIQLKVNSSNIEISSDDIHLSMWNNGGNISIVNSLFSKRYNEISKNKRIKSQLNTNHMFYDGLTVFSLNEGNIVQEISAYQNNSKNNMELIKGVKIIGNINEEIYFLRKPIVHGNKIFITNDGSSFYGKVNYYNGNQFIRIR